MIPKESSSNNTILGAGTTGEKSGGRGLGGYVLSVIHTGSCGLFLCEDDLVKGLPP